MTLAVVLMGLTAANAQLVIGGGFGLGGNVGNVQKADGVVTDKADNTFYFSLLPKVGYMLKDGKMEVGARLNFNYLHTTQFTVFNEQVSKDQRSYSASLEVAPYFRYFFLRKGIFNLGIEANMDLGGSFAIANKFYAIEDFRTQKEANEMTKQSKTAIKDGKPTNFNWGISVVPVMMFNLTQHCYMELALNAVGIGIWGNKSTSQFKMPNDEIVKMTDSDFGGGINYMNVAQDFFSLGFAYKF